MKLRYFWKLSTKYDSVFSAQWSESLRPVDTRRNSRRCFRPIFSWLKSLWFSRQLITPKRPYIAQIQPVVGFGYLLYVGVVSFINEVAA